MPLFKETVFHYVDHVLGPGKLSFTYGYVSESSDFTQRQYDDAILVAEADVRAFADAVNWNRLVLEAQGRCLALGHDHAFSDDPLEVGVCGESLQKALLMTEHFARWA